MSDWGEFAIVFIAFYLSHMIPARPTIRAWLANALGERLYLLLYIAFSILLLTWLIGAAGRAPYVALWDRAAWQNLVPQILMLPACALVVFGLGADGGLSLGSRSDVLFDPARPGITAITRHPLLWALALWSLVHLLPNGDLAHGLMFGSFALSALLGMVMFDRRTARRIGVERWQDVHRVTAFIPLGQGLAGHRIEGLWPKALSSVALYGILLLSHPHVIGVSPL